ncbi:MAG: DUF5020 domain-containing protein [Alphaproteobacteria bacterium]|nr:DUF5020 domain-containing protein [Alphaproteobacteria bacterium]
MPVFIYYFTFLMTIIAILFSTAAHAKFVQFHTTNVQLLKGWDYKLGEENRTLITLEHYNKWAYGDFYMFIDTTRFDNGGSNIYGEAAARLSYEKTTGNLFNFGIVKDIYLATMLEKGKHGYETYLYGASADYDVPGFSLFRVDTYIRDNPDISGRGWQVTWAYRHPFSWQSYDFMVEGFADFAGREGGRHSNQLIVPRFLMDVGKASGHKAGKLYAGVEWSYWHNKFGIKGITESVPQAQIKWVFN